MKDETVSALVLKSTDYKESDRLLTVLTAEQGILTVNARGVRKINSKNASAVGLFGYASMELVRNGDRRVLKTASATHTFPGISSRLEAFSLACYFSELTTALLAPETPEPDVLRLFLDTLFVLENDKSKPLWLIKGAFETKLLSLLGFVPAPDVCAGCARPLPAGNAPHVCLLPDFSFLCPDCASGESPSPDRVSLAGDVIRALQYLSHCPVERFCSFSLSETLAPSFAALCERMVLATAERSFDTLRYYKSLF